MKCTLLFVAASFNSFLNFLSSLVGPAFILFKNSQASSPTKIGVIPIGFAIFFPPFINNSLILII